LYRHILRVASNGEMVIDTRLAITIRRREMLSLLILLAAQSAVAEDQSQFDKAWTQRPPTQAEWPFSKALAYDLYEWSQAQFALGYCSQFDTDAERMRNFPNEQELILSRLGHGLITTARASFEKGVKFREAIKPTSTICQNQLAIRGGTLKSIIARNSNRK
jgi:hypothetical protein